MKAIAVRVGLVVMLTSVFVSGAKAAGFEQLYSFPRPPVSSRAKLVQGSDGNFYGTTYWGGNTNNDGTVFRITPGGTLTTLVFFNNSNGKSPSAELVQGNDGNFYGTTSSGGTDGNGTVFKMTPTGALTTLVSFRDSHLDQFVGLIQGRDGNFYGTTSRGGK